MAIALYDPDLDDNARTRDASWKKLGVGRGPDGTGAMGDIADD
jgi:hypothetical protein